MAKDILERYKPKECPGRKSFEELQNWIKSRLDIQEIAIQEFSKPFIQHLYFNAFHALTNQRLRLNYDDFSFVAYKLLFTERNEAYNEDFFRRANGEEFIYIVLEKRTGYILCNNNQLFLQLKIEQGIAQDEFDSGGPALLEYVSCIAFLDQKEY